MQSLPHATPDMIQLARELHAPAYKPSAFRQVRTWGIDDVWTCDLMDLSWANAGAFEGHNDARYVLCVMDCFSRMAWAEPLKSKTAQETWTAFHRILHRSRRAPKHLWCDAGGEFVNKLWTKGLKELGCERYHTYGLHKACMIERFNQTLGQMLWRHVFTPLQTRKWAPYLQDVLAYYNAKEHSALGVSPTEASKPENEWPLMVKQYGRAAMNEPEARPKYAVGDWCRIARVKELFEKGNTARWSGERFKVMAVKEGWPSMYTLQAENGESIDGSWYEAEMQRTAAPTSDDLALIEEVLKKRKRGGREELFVKFLGYPDSYSRWIPASDVTRTF